MSVRFSESVGRLEFALSRPAVPCYAPAMPIVPSRFLVALLVASLVASSSSASESACARLLERSYGLPGGDIEVVHDLWRSYANLLRDEQAAQRTRFLGTPLPAPTATTVESRADLLVMHYETGRDLRDEAIFRPDEIEALSHRLERIDAALAGSHPGTLTRPLHRGSGIRLLANPPDPEVPTPAVAAQSSAPPAAVRTSWLRRFARWQTPALVVGGALGGAIGVLGGKLQQLEKVEKQTYVDVAAKANERVSPHPAATTDDVRRGYSTWWRLRPGERERFERGRLNRSDFEEVAQRINAPSAAEVLFTLVGAVVFAGVGAGAGWAISRPMAWHLRRIAEPAPRAASKVAEPMPEPQPATFDEGLGVPALRTLFATLQSAENLECQVEPVRYRHVGISTPGRHYDVLIETRRNHSGPIQVRGAIVHWTGPLDFWPPGRTRREVMATELGSGTPAEAQPRFDVRAQLEAAHGRYLRKLPEDLLPNEKPITDASALLHRAQTAGLTPTQAMEVVRLWDAAPAEDLAAVVAYLNGLGK